MPTNDQSRVADAVVRQGHGVENQVAEQQDGENQVADDLGVGLDGHVHGSAKCDASVGPGFDVVCLDSGAGRRSTRARWRSLDGRRCLVKERLRELDRILAPP